MTDLENLEQLCRTMKINFSSELNADGFYWASITGEVDNSAYIRFNQDGSRAIDDDLVYNYE